MNISKAQIAALVLGYLKTEQLHSVVEEFVKCSSHFEGSHENIKVGQYFVTRVFGMSLVDFLHEYTMIYAIVQSRLELTDFYERYSRTTLVEQLMYLLDPELTDVATSTPVLNAISEVDATPAHALPGNSSFCESDYLVRKTPKKRRSRSRSKDREAVVDVTEVLTQSLLGNHELHEKIAETINMVRNTPDGGRSVPEESISAGASKEIDAVIKTVIERTEGDPVYNKLIDEIIGTTTYENPSNKKSISFSTPTSSFNTDDLSKSKTNISQVPNNIADPMDDHNIAAIRSIMEAAQNTDPPPPTSDSGMLHAPNKPGTSAEVYVFDGSLDTYLKTSGATNPLNPNTVYFNPNNNVIVVPPDEAAPKQFYLVNPTQPMLKLNTPTLLTEEELLSCPTIIVNDETAPAPSVDGEEPRAAIAAKKVKLGKRPRPVTVRARITDSVPILPKRAEPASVKAETAEVVAVNVASAPVQQPAAVAVAAARPAAASHVRNLDFSSPSRRRSEIEARHRKKGWGVWDASLRQLVNTCKDKSPSPKRKRPNSSRKSKKKQADQVDEPAEEPGAVENIEENDIDIEDIEKNSLQTPIKDMIPKTPGAMIDNSSFHCTPFNEVIDEQLKGVDLNLIDTPNIPITPGFALTPGDGLITNQRLTDYSTSSSYYQPSEHEQSKTMCQLIEECVRLEKTEVDKDKEEKPSPEKLNNVVIAQPKVPDIDKKPETKKTNERLKKFNNNIIGKKNLSLIRHPTSSSSESDSDSDLEKAIENDDECNDQTVKKVNNTAVIKDIIDTVKVTNTLNEDKKDLLSHLEVVRKRTVDKIKKSTTSKTPARNNRKPPQKPKTPKSIPKAAKTTPKSAKTKKTKKKQTHAEDTTYEEAQKLVKGLAKRGIHLVPNKTPQKKVAEWAEVPASDDSMTFDHKVYDRFEIVMRSERSSRKKNQKMYDVSVLKKSMSVNVLIEDEEVARVLRWTSCDCLFDSRTSEHRKVTHERDEIDDDELMDYCVVASVTEQSADGTDGETKRNMKCSKENNQQKNKKNTEYQSLLKNIDVDEFLNQLHGE